MNIIDVDDQSTCLQWKSQGNGEECGLLLDPPSESIPKEELSTASLDMLAVAFTVVKIHYICGRFSALPALFRVIEPSRTASAQPLHGTSIRNEAAYYCCIAHVLAERNASAEAIANPYSDQIADVTADPMFVLGDSHVLPLAWARLQGSGRQLVPKLVTGVKHWHLRPESRFYPKFNFLQALKTIPDSSDVIFTIGEIDCREGILVAVEKCIYDSVEQVVQFMTLIYTHIGNS